MKPLFLLLLLLGFLHAGTSAAQEAENPVTQLHGAYEQAIQFAAEPLEELDARYVEELKKLKEKIQKQGNLENALKTQHEIENYAKSEERNFADLPDLRRLREIYDRSRRQRSNEVLQKQEEIVKQSIQKFEQLKESLTKQGKLDLALEADKYRTQLSEKLTAIAKPGTTGASELGNPNALWALRTKGDFKSVQDCEADRKDDVWLLTSEKKAMSYIESDKSFRPPFSARGRIGTDTVEIRIFYAGRQMVIFNWSSNPQQLRIQNPVTGKAMGIQGTGYLEKDKLHDVEIQVTAEKIRVFAGGEPRGEMAGDFKDLDGPFGIGPAFGSKVMVQSLEISELKPD